MPTWTQERAGTTAVVAAILWQLPALIVALLALRGDGEALLAPEHAATVDPAVLRGGFSSISHGCEWLPWR